MNLRTEPVPEALHALSPSLPSMRGVIEFQSLTPVPLGMSLPKTPVSDVVTNARTVGQASVIRRGIQP
jgi:hypothetical protein